MKSKSILTWKRAKIILLVIFITMIIISCWLLSNFIQWGNYEKKFSRVYDTNNEGKALVIAEKNISYYSICGYPRFDGEYANYIDQLTIRHYVDLMDYWKAKNVARHIILNYDALSVYMTRIDIIWTNNKLIISNNSNLITEIPFSSPDSNGFRLRVFKYNETGKLQDYNIIQHSLRLIDSYFVYMKLLYQDLYSNHGGYYIYVEQFLFLDLSYSPIIAYINPADYDVTL